MRSAIALTACALALSACGGSGEDPRLGLVTPPEYRGAKPIETPSATLDRPVGERDERRLRPVMEAWAAALRRDDSPGAARFFALPALIYQPSRGPMTLVDTRAITAFNAALPCGAKLVASTHRGRYVIGTFALTDRYGRDHCTDAGHLVKVGFVSDGRRFSEFWQEAPRRRGQAPGPAHRPKAPVVDASEFGG